MAFLFQRDATYDGAESLPAVDKPVAHGIFRLVLWQGKGVAQLVAAVQENIQQGVAQGRHISGCRIVFDGSNQQGIHHMPAGLKLLELLFTQDIDRGGRLHIGYVDLHFDGHAEMFGCHP